MKSDSQVKNIRHSHLRPPWLNGDTMMENIKLLKNHYIKESIATIDNNNALDHIFHLKGAIHDIWDDSYADQQSFLVQTELMVQVGRSAVDKFCHAYIDDVTNFCAKYNGKKWLGHLIFVRSKTGNKVYLVGAIFTVDYNASAIQGKFHIWYSNWNYKNSNICIIHTWHCDWFKGYWNIILNVCNGMSVTEYTLWGWFKALKLPLLSKDGIPLKSPVSLLNVCWNHGAGGVSRKYKSQPITKHICKNTFNFLRLEKSIDTFLVILSVFHYILISDWIDLLNFNVTILNIKTLLLNDDLEEEIDERAHRYKRKHKCVIFFLFNLFTKSFY